MPTETGAPAPNPSDTSNASAAYDVAILGSGPAGYTAAIYAARANLRTLVLQGEQPGGQLTITSEVENYPGYPDGVLGPEMMEQFEAQAKRFGAVMVPSDAVRVDLSRQPFRLWTADGEYQANAVIVATGASAKWLGLPNEQRLQKRGVSGCATCDGFFFKGKDVVVVGGGDTAMEEALFLTRYANRVYLIHRRDAFRASKIMQQRAREHPKITILYNSAVEDVLGEHAVDGVVVRNVVTGASEVLRVQGLFVAIGHQPNTGIFRGVLHMDDQGYLIPERYTMSSVPGVFIAGDVADHRYRQAVTAAGDGCRAAIDAERWLESKGEVDENVVRDPRDYGMLRDVPTGQVR
jgi:thioredoxin reductase (NADPH)